MLKLPALLVSVAAWFSALSAGGQTIPAGTYDVPPLVVGDNESIGSNTTLNIYQAGAVAQNFSAGVSGQNGVDLVVNLAGGMIGDGFTARKGAVVNVSAGSIGSNATAGIGSHLRLTGGTVGYGLRVAGGLVEVDGGSLTTVDVSGGGTLNVISGHGGTVDYLSGTLNVSGGEVRTRNTMFGTINLSGGKIALGIVTGQGAKLNVSGGELVNAYIYYQSTVNISGGKVTSGLHVVNASTLQMTGGVVENDFYIGSNSPTRLAGGVVGDWIEKTAGSQRLVLAGSDFRLNGVPIANLAADGDQLAFDLPNGGVLTGVYPDGTPFAYSSVEGDKLPAGSLMLEQASLAGAHPTIILLPAEPAPQGVHTGQTLNVQSGAAVSSHLMAGWGSTVNIDGGQVGYDFEAAGAAVNVSAGSIGNAFDMFHGSILNVSGGTLGTDGRLHGAALQMTGGVVGASLDASNSSLLQLAGGAIGDRLKLDASSQLAIVGGDFRLDGVPIAGLNQPGDMAPLDLPSAVVLSGILADGTPFAVTTHDGDTLPAGVLTLQQSALPPIGSAAVDAAVDEVGQGIRTGQTLAVGAGSQLPAHFNMAPGAQLNVSGGDVGQNLEAVGATINLSSGVIGPDFDAYQGTVLNMTGGQLDQNAWLDNGSQFIQSGGVSSSLAAMRASIVQVTGGKAGGVTANQGSRVTLSGGELQGLALSESQGAVSGGVMTGTLTLGAASSLQWTGGRVAAVVASSSTAAVTIEGAEFYLDGAAVGGLNMPGDQVLLQVPAGAVLSGVLADGTTLAIGNHLRNNDRLPSNQVTLRYSALPPSSAAIIQVPSDPPPTSVRSGQTLRVEQGGVVGNHLTAGNGSRVEVTAGGSIGDNFEAVGAEVLVSGGQIGQRLDLFAGATLTMLSGSIGVGGNSNGVQVLGGTLDLYGGEVVSALTVENGGALNVFGYDFTLAGAPIAGLLSGETLTVAQRDGATLAGKLADGTPFDFRLQQSTSRSFDIFSLDSTVTITLAEPAPLPGDFNDDGAIDGSDFLAWQRGETLFPLSEFELAAWKANYGTTLSQTASSTSVPEPSTSSGIVLIGLVSMICRRRWSCLKSF
jgi:hypothetical protein